MTFNTTFDLRNMSRPGLEIRQAQLHTGIKEGRIAGAAMRAELARINDELDRRDRECVQ